jgi:ElaB/YqjD/DUF883 family membrane-anchored ribosome-binding protein
MQQTDGGIGYRSDGEFAAANEMEWRGAGWRDSVEHRVDDARDALARADEMLREGVRQRPFMAVGLALAVGYLIGRALIRD